MSSILHCINLVEVHVFLEMKVYLPPDQQGVWLFQRDVCFPLFSYIWHRLLTQYESSTLCNPMPELYSGFQNQAWLLHGDIFPIYCPESVGDNPCAFELLLDLS